MFAERLIFNDNKDSDFDACLVLTIETVLRYSLTGSYLNSQHMSSAVLVVNLILL